MVINQTVITAFMPSSDFKILFYVHYFVALHAIILLFIYRVESIIVPLLKLKNKLNYRDSGHSPAIQKKNRIKNKNVLKADLEATSLV